MVERESAALLHKETAQEQPWAQSSPGTTLSIWYLSILQNVPILQNPHRKIITLDKEPSKEYPGLITD